MRLKILISVLSLVLILILILVAVTFLTIKQPQKISNQNISGELWRSQIWSGEIIITGDTLILQDLTITPGSVIKFALQDDQQQGYETPADGFNDLDPTRLLDYGKNHSSLTILGKLTAIGTPEKKILFTSAASIPKIADWEAIYPHGDESTIEYSIIEYSRNGISPGDEETPNSIFRNNIIRHTFWGAISGGWSSFQAYNNEIYECGHEGIDVQGNNPIIENNSIHTCHVGIVVLRGSAMVRNNVMKNVGHDIHLGKDATPILENNIVELAPANSTKEWRYGNFAYPMFGDPIGTPILTQVYSEKIEGKDLPRYAVPVYRIEHQDYTTELPLEIKTKEIKEWLGYGWKNNRWQKIDIELNIEKNKIKFPSGYSMYVLIPEPTENEKDVEKFNKEHADIYRIMAV